MTWGQFKGSGWPPHRPSFPRHQIVYWLVVHSSTFFNVFSPSNSSILSLKRWVWETKERTWQRMLMYPSRKWRRIIGDQNRKKRWTKKRSKTIINQVRGLYMKSHFSCGFSCLVFCVCWFASLQKFKETVTLTCNTWRVVFGGQDRFRRPLVDTRWATLFYMRTFYFSFGGGKSLLRKKWWREVASRNWRRSWE